MAQGHVNCFDDVPEFQMAREVQEARRQRLVVRADHQAQSERRLLLNQALAEAKAELARLQEEHGVQEPAVTTTTSVTALMTSSQSRTPFVACCEECGIEHSSLVGAPDPGDGRWYCNGCWVKWNLPDPEPEEDGDRSEDDIVFDDIVFDEDDGLSSETQEHSKAITEELFEGDETKTIPMITGLLDICYSDDLEKRQAKEKV